MNEIEKMTKKSQLAMSTAAQLAENSRNPSVEPAHLIIALIEQPNGIVLNLFKKLDVDSVLLRKQVEEELEKLSSVDGVSKIMASSELVKVFGDSEKESKKMGDSYISTEHFILAILKNKKLKEKEILEKNGITLEAFEKVLSETRGEQKITDDDPESKFDVLNKYARDLTELAEEGKLDPVIGRDVEIRRVIQVLARRTKNNPVLIGEPGVGKTAIAEGLALRIINEDIPEVLIGKKLMSLDLGALVAGAKYRGEFEDRLKAVIKEVTSSNGEIILFIDELHTLVGAGKTDGAMDAGQLLKPALARGELRCIGATTLDEYRRYIEKDAALERRFQQILVPEPSVDDAITILRGLKKKYEVHHGVRIKDAAIIAAVRLSNRYITSRFLPDKAIDLMDEASSKLAIEIGSVPVIIDEKQRRITQLQIEQTALKKETDSSAVERLAVVKSLLIELGKEVQDLTNQWNLEKSGISGVKDLKEKLESLRIEAERAERDGDLEKAAELKYGAIPEFEQKLKFLEKSLEEKAVKENDENRMLKEEVGEEEIAEVISLWTGVPVNKMLGNESDRLLSMESILRNKVVGQDPALEVISDAIRRARTEIADPNKPIGSFMFLGPTGVGKTETVKALADFLFDDEQSIIRVDMSEYMEKHSVARLIGAPPGYVGFEDGGQLTEQVRRKPYSVILFDEIEKAHSDVFNILLQVLDDGRLTDGQGRVVDFKNSVLVMTSNVGSNAILNVEMSVEEREGAIGFALKEHFRPEFLNRIDEKVIFNSLKKEQISGIVKIQLEAVLDRLKSKKIKLAFSEEVIELLVTRGIDPIYGARPLKRVIQSLILNPLAKKMIEGVISENSEVFIDLLGGKVVFK